MMVDSPFCSTGTVGYSTRAENYGRVTAVCCHGACPRCADREESPECDASAIADGALCSTASATSCVLPASAGGLAANMCVDAWALAFPTEVHRWQGRSCHFKRKWRQCSEFWAGCRCSCGNCSASGGHQPQSCAPHAAITTAAAIATDGASNLKALAGPPPSSSSSSSPLSGAATALAIAAEAGGASPATVAVLLTGGGSVLLFAGVALCCFLSGGKGGGKGGGGASSRRQRRPRSGAASPLSDEDEFGSFHGPSSSCWLEDDDGSGERRAGTRGARGTTREALRRRDTSGGCGPHARALEAHIGPADSVSMVGSQPEAHGLHHIAFKAAAGRHRPSHRPTPLPSPNLALARPSAATPCAPACRAGEDFMGDLLTVHRMSAGEAFDDGTHFGGGSLQGSLHGSLHGSAASLTLSFDSDSSSSRSNAPQGVCVPLSAITARAFEPLVETSERTEGSYRSSLPASPARATSTRGRTTSQIAGAVNP
ncbi:hypothetical protein EMIHUDRAFT_96090 [Emiliania huxleyi CCMP1516]|uniref:ShKT domain-containing protein n=2 Tax=Emiliania huxleyi TaxID=2903 RepID=A0A0D3J4C0_EMIH1|nr:hypothetical protein EMIHUDRAFT_96090 [Emiliania huxleyi CCMP1516]EOD18355.1 hypothetical protein EMIHUDRAFT_96090 [Emiliania huxleyi CCMP1516]|eukprot:XP_005770784.1 hypothetical protein EMIHUDRAFT_96090 [Emiliania huxleyi CCMP1516]